MLEEEVEQEHKLELYRDYVGQTLWVLNSIAHLYTTGKNDMPQYVELSHPEAATKKMTAAEIKQHILKELGY